ncbi:MAG: hypothetical protein IJ916_12550 [Paludibacteraceae bacterium]|nr:hypothetical protein [Paludibacteraceae bacterium]
MDKLNFLVLCVFSLSFFSCEPDMVDDITTECYSFVITNGTSKKLDIVYEHMSKSENGLNTEVFTLYPSDSIVRIGETDGIAGEILPFRGFVFLVFDDFTYLCERNTDGYCMINSSYTYKKEKQGSNVYVCRYTITEEDYEYAKAHPYLSRQESEE